MSVLEYVSVGTGPGGTDEIKQVSDVDPLPSLAQINGDVIVNSSSKAFEFDDFIANANGTGYSAGNILRRVSIFGLDVAGVPTVNWYNLSDDLAAPVKINTPTANSYDPIAVSSTENYQFHVVDYTAVVDKPVPGFHTFFYEIGDHVQNVICYETNQFSNLGINVPSSLNLWYNITKNTQFGAPITPADIATDLVLKGESSGSSGRVGADADYFVVTLTHTCVADPGTTFTDGDILRRIVTSDANSDAVTEMWAKLNGDGQVTVSYGVGVFPRINQIRPYVYDESTRPRPVEIVNQNSAPAPVAQIDETRFYNQIGMDLDQADCSVVGFGGILIEGLYAKNQDSTAKAYVMVAGNAYTALADAAARVAYVKENGVELSPGQELSLSFKIDCTGVFASQLVFCSDVAPNNAKSLKLAYSYYTPFR